MGERLTGDYRKHQDKPYLGHWDLPKNEDLVLTIDHSEKNMVRSKTGEDLKTIIFWKENYKPFICNITNARSIKQACGSWDMEKWENKKIALYIAPVPQAEDGVAIRIRDYPPKTTEYICADCGRIVTDHGKHSAEVIANRAITRFGTALCYDCSVIRAEREEQSAAD